jgi:hypothetical protein
MMMRRAFLGGTLSVVTVGSCEAQSEQQTRPPIPPGPLVWPVVRKPEPSIRSFVGHTDTVPDIVGRIGTPPSLVIFTEGNHLMALLSDDIVGAFPLWATSQPQYPSRRLESCATNSPTSRPTRSDPLHGVVPAKAGTQALACRDGFRLSRE